MDSELAFHDETSTSSTALPSLLFALAGLVVGAGIGAGLMFLLDPQSGRRRRALLRDRAVHLRSRGREELEERVGDLSGRSRGLAASVRARLARERVNEATLAARVRARLGHVVSNPAAIAVSADGGRVTLRGTVPPDELEDVLDEVSSVRGVREVYNLLQLQLGVPQPSGHH